MKYKIRNVSNQHEVVFDANHIAICSGLDIAWISTDNNLTTVTLFTKQYDVILHDRIIYVERRWN